MSKVLLFLCLTVLTAGSRPLENFALEPEAYPPKKRPKAFPKTCEAGVIDLQGVYEVKEDTTIRGCNLRGSGATIMLGAHLTFSQGSGHEAISWLGAMRFVGKRSLSSLKESCITVHGHLVIGGEPESELPDTNINFLDCHNEGSFGGALHVTFGLTLRSGFVMFRRSNSLAGGGGLYVENGGLRQEGGSIVLKDCGSDGSGGGLLIDSGDFQQDAGDISCIGCAAAQQGGCLAIRNSANISGSIHAEECSAASGGAVFVTGPLVSSGLMEFASCRAKAGGGGGLLVKSDFTQQAGSMKFRSCAASEDGGAMDLGKNMYASGTMAFYACRADGDGGAINLQDDLQQAGTGNMSFASCAARRGGAVAVCRLETSGIVKFKDCHAADSGGAAVVETDFAQKAGRMEFESCTAGKSGGAAVIRGDLVSDGQCSITGGNAEEGSVLEVLGDITVQEFPTDCPDGELNLTGMFLVDWLPSLDGNCKVRGTGATVLLKEPLVFEGAVEFLGLITFIGLSPMEQACVTVHGSVTIGGSDEADILFADCHNEDNTSAGGALHIARGLAVVSGVLEIDRSSSLTGGGGVYIDSGNLRQAGGRIKIKASTSADLGGGLLINNGSLVQSAGQISCYNCSAKHGGCLALNSVDNYSLQTNGSLEAESCTAAAGGALYIKAGHWISFGHINFNRCHAQNGPGGAAWTRNGSFFQMKGSVTITSCTSSESSGSPSPQAAGGGMKVTGTFVQEEGLLSCHACNSSTRGGCMVIVDKFVQSKRSSANFTACHASGNGGALSVQKGVILGGSGTFDGCSSTGLHGGCIHSLGHVDFRGFSSFTRCEASHNGGAVFAHSAKSTGHIAFRRCIAGQSGGGLHLEAFHQVGGSAVFSRCGAMWTGGGLTVKGNISLEGSSKFLQCGEGHWRPMLGGGLHAGGSLVIFGKSSLKFRACEATRGGGGLAVNGSMASKGRLSFLKCMIFNGSHDGGGGLLLRQDLRQRGGQIIFKQCEAKNGTGGGLRITEGSLIHSAGRLYITSCKASRGGGGDVELDVVQHRGKLSVAECSSQTGGGGMHIGGNFKQESRGVAEFSGCVANGGGGGLAADGSVYLEGSSKFRSCTAAGRARKGPGGGGLLVLQDFFQNGGNISFEDCTAERYGGGLQVAFGNFTTTSSGVVNFKRCKALLGGGGAAVTFDVHARANSRMSFESCTAEGSESGGGMGIGFGSLFQHGADISFSSCKAPGSKGGGLALLRGSLHQFTGSLGFEGCSSEEGGGLFVGKDVLMAGGCITFSSCRALQEGGGAGAVVKQDFLQNAGELLADSCISNFNGGGLLVGGTFTQALNASARFSACRARAGGGLSVNGSVNLSGSSTFDKCVATGDLQGEGGGGLYTQETFTQLSGITNFTECHTLRAGGALRVRNGSLIVNSGTVKFQSCRAAHSGGGAEVGRHIRVGPDAEMFFHECGSESSGGGVHAEGHVIQDGGSILFDRCEASESRGRGGGLYIASGYLHQKGGRMQFVGCRAAIAGGISVHLYVVVDDLMILSGCQASQSSVGGGCMYVERGDLHLRGNLSMKNCSSLGSGGGLLMDGGGVRQRATGILTFDHCHAHGGNGGGMATCSLVSSGIMDFSSCTASQGGSGGGIYVSMGNGTVQQDAGHISFENCTAGQGGGGFYSESVGPGNLADMFFSHCTAEGNAGTLYAESDVLNVSKLTILEPRSADFDVVSEGTLVLNDLHLHSMNQKFSMGIRARSLSAGTVNCTSLKSCSLAAPEHLIADLVCPTGTGIEEGKGLKSCKACKDDFTQPAGQAKCVSCPTHNEFCYATNFKMAAGYMVKQKDISSTIFCPNPAACPGGISTDFSTMCAPGHEGQACAYCRKGYAISDTSVLQCAPCAKEWWQKLLQWAIMLAKHAVPFAVAAHSALQVEGAEEPKRSGVLINQLMSFATVAGTLLTVVAQTSAIRESKQNAASLAQTLLDAAGIATDFVSGQGSGGVGSSSSCLLSFPGKLWPAHLLHTAIPTAMVLVLIAFRPKAQHGVVLVVGLNCFWPVIFSYFGKYLYCFQFEPESSGYLQTRECPFLKEESHRHVVRILMVSAFLAVSYVWVRLSLSKEDGPKPPLHVIFLSRAYRKTCQLWESERLTRKTLLTLAVSALPITSSPSLQLVCIATIVVGSLFLHAAVLPYKTMRFNLTECALLATAALMTATVTGLTAYDHYWGRTMLVEYLMIFSVVGMATLTCAAMIFLIVKELLQESRDSRGRRTYAKAEAPWLWGTYFYLEENF